MNGYVIESLSLAGEYISTVRHVPNQLAGRHRSPAGRSVLASIFTSLYEAIDFADALEGSHRVVARRRTD